MLPRTSLERVTLAASMPQGPDSRTRIGFLETSGISLIILNESMVDPSEVYCLSGSNICLTGVAINTGILLCLYLAVFPCSLVYIEMDIQDWFCQILSSSHW